MKLPSPQRLGLPSKFERWRLTQERAIISLLDSEVRFDGINMPTGSGKSALSIAVAQLLPPDDRVLILTSTKALQDQVAREFEELGLRDVRGKSNYKCVAGSRGGDLADSSADSHVTVEHGPCFTSATPCPLTAGGCTYYDATRAARGARIVSTSYAKWISTPDPDETFGKFSWLICDEAGDAEQHLTDALRIELNRVEVESLLHISWPNRSGNGVGATRIADWREWSMHHRNTADGTLLTAESQLKEAVMTGGAGSRQARELQGRVAALRKVVTAIRGLRTLRGDWVLDDLRVYDRIIGAQFDPVWPAAYSEGLLFRGIERVVLMGATLVEKHLDILGVPVDRRSFSAYPSLFPVARRPIIFLKLDPPLKMNYASERDEGLRRRVVEVGDALFDARMDRKGLTHTHSYARRDWIVARSRHRDLIVTHAKTSEATREAVERFKRMDAPARLDSPSISTGWDFPGDTAEWQWIPKLPFENRDTALTKARLAIYPKYLDFRMANTFTQMCGRIVRSMSDAGQTICTDPMLRWHPWANKELYAPYILDALRTTTTLPAPLPKLRS